MAYENYVAGIKYTGNPSGKRILTKEEFEFIRNTKSYDDFIAGIKYAGNRFNKRIPTKEEYDSVPKLLTGINQSKNTEPEPETTAETKISRFTDVNVSATHFDSKETDSPAVEPTNSEMPEKKRAAGEPMETSEPTENERAFSKIRELSSRHPELITISTGSKPKLINMALTKPGSGAENEHLSKRIIGGNAIMCLGLIKKFLTNLGLEQKAVPSESKDDRSI